MERVYRIETQYSPGKSTAKPDRAARYAPERIRAYVGAERADGTAPATLVATDGRILSAVPAVARSVGTESPTGPAAFYLPAVVGARAVKTKPRRRDVAATVGAATVTVAETGADMAATDNTGTFPAWSNIVPKPDGATSVSVAFSVELLCKLADSLRDVGHASGDPQVLRLTFTPDRNGNAATAILVTSGPKPAVVPPECEPDHARPVGMIMPVHVDGTAESHRRYVAEGFAWAAGIARTTGATETA